MPESPLKWLIFPEPAKITSGMNRAETTYVVVEIDVVDGKLRDGSDNGGIVGTESGGKPEGSILNEVGTTV